MVIFLNHKYKAFGVFMWRKAKYVRFMDEHLLLIFIIDLQLLKEFYNRILVLQKYLQVEKVVFD